MEHRVIAQRTRAKAKPVVSSVATYMTEGAFLKLPKPTNSTKLNNPTLPKKSKDAKPPTGERSTSESESNAGTSSDADSEVSLTTKLSLAGIEPEKPPLPDPRYSGLRIEKTESDNIDT